MIMQCFLCGKNGFYTVFHAIFRLAAKRLPCYKGNVAAADRHGRKRAERENGVCRILWFIFMRSDKQFTFPYPKRGLGVLIVFLAFAPPIQVIVAALSEHKFIGGRRILFEIAELLRERAFPFLLSGYALYMPPVFFAALWSAWRSAFGYALTVNAAITHMLLCGLACEFLYQSFVLAAGGALRADILLTGILQWIISAFCCWWICACFGWDKKA